MVKNTATASEIAAGISTAGISTSELDTGLDIIEIAVRQGETPQNCKITRRLDEDSATVKLGIGGGR